MQVWERHSVKDILLTLEIELAKGKSELACAEADIQKVKNRITFIISAIHHLKTRQEV